MNVFVAIIIAFVCYVFFIAIVGVATENPSSKILKQPRFRAILLAFAPITVVCALCYIVMHALYTFYVAVVYNK